VAIKDFSKYLELVNDLLLSFSKPKSFSEPLAVSKSSKPIPPSTLILPT
jgi:hypothetical protein